LEEKIMNRLKNIFALIAILFVLSTAAIAQDKGATGNASSNGDKITRVRVEYMPATIEKAQQALKAKGFYKGEITGKMDPATRDSVKAFQKQEGISPTGRLNKDTRVKLNIEDASATKSPSRKQSKSSQS
jgi:peptidoglycan hydrolase-like protein with peptidoglycan-binding domain